MGDRPASAARRRLRVAGFLVRSESRFAGGRCRKYLADPVRFALGSVLDFLAEDGCALCRRPHASLRSLDAAADEPLRYLLEPVAVRRFFGALKAVNHPVCAACAARFVVARSTGVLGRIAGASSIQTALGETLTGRRESGPAADPLEKDESAPDNLPEGGAVRIVAPFMTTDPALKVIHLLKFGGYPELAMPVARSVAWAVRRAGPGGPGTAPILVPTPMDRRSQRERGFNHAVRIARVLAAELGHPVAPDLLLKRPGAKMQSRTRREDRAQNVRDAFWCPASAAAELAGVDAILVDDLVTTGATAAACGAALLGAGARSVTVVCFGRAM